jgi:hypothetical protein
MFYVVLGLCAFVFTASLVGYWQEKTRLADQDLNKVIEGKFLTSKHMVELNRLQEENVVLRNLLKDMVENEASVAVVLHHTPTADKSRLFTARDQRRREIFGEAMHFLQNGDDLKVLAKQVAS